MLENDLYFWIPYRIYRDSLWNNLTALSLDEALSWCYSGDFNAIRSLTDKLDGCIVTALKVLGFNDFIKCCAMLELPWQGYPFA